MGTDKEQLQDMTDGGAEDFGNSRGGERRFPEWFDYLVFMAIFLGATVVAGICLAIFQNYAAGVEEELRTVIVYAVQFTISILGILYYVKRRRGPENVFRFSIRWYNASLVLLGIVLMLAGSVVMEPLLKLFPEHYFKTLDDAIGSGGWAILNLVLLAPVMEEMLFRGLLLEPARQKWGATAAVFISAALFGLVHFPILPQMVNAFVMGVMLGYVYVLTCSLLSVIIIHAVNNALAYLFLEVTGSQNTDLQAVIGNDTVYWIVYSVCLAVFVASLASMAVAATDKRRKRAGITAVFTAAPETENLCGAPDGNNNKG